MKFMCFVFVFLLSTTQLSQGNSISGQKFVCELTNDPTQKPTKETEETIKPLDSYQNHMTKSSDTSTVDRIDKLIADAEEIKDMYEQLMKSILGPQFEMATEHIVSMGNSRRAAGEWIRATINETLLNRRNQNLKSNNSTSV